MHFINLSQKCIITISFIKLTRINLVGFDDKNHNSKLTIEIFTYLILNTIILKAQKNYFWMKDQQLFVVFYPTRLASHFNLKTKNELVALEFEF